MKAYVITAAGLSSRFSESLGREALKCIYHEGDPLSSLVGRLLVVAPRFDSVVLVGGYKIDELKRFIDDELPSEITDKICVVENKRYAELASGWSLYMGLRALDLEKYDMVLFAEGDLFVDAEAMNALAAGTNDAVTVSPDPIYADKAVALYFDVRGIPRFSYSQTHEALTIAEPFISVHSSGQMWRFADTARLSKIVEDFRSKGGAGTNLRIIGNYFEGSNPNEIEVVRFKEWVNCNTIEDWKRAFS